MGVSAAASRMDAETHVLPSSEESASLPRRFGPIASWEVSPPDLRSERCFRAAINDSECEPQTGSRGVDSHARRTAFVVVCLAKCEYEGLPDVTTIAHHLRHPRDGPQSPTGSACSAGREPSLAVDGIVGIGHACKSIGDSRYSSAE